MQFLAVVAHTYNPGTQEAEPGKSFEFEASLVSRVPESQAQQRNPVLKKTKTNYLNATIIFFQTVLDVVLQTETDGSL